MPRSGDSRMHSGVVPSPTDQSGVREKSAEGRGINMSAAGNRNENFLSDLRLDRLRQTDDNVHPGFKQLDQGAVLDQSLNSRSFQPESYQGPLDIGASQDAVMVQDASQRNLSQDQPREGIMPDSSTNDTPGL